MPPECDQVQLELVQKCSKERQQLFHQWRQEHEDVSMVAEAQRTESCMYATRLLRRNHSRCCLRTNVLRGKSRARVTARPYTRGRFQAPLRKGFPSLQNHKNSKMFRLSTFPPNGNEKSPTKHKKSMRSSEGFILRIQILCPENAHPIV